MNIPIIARRIIDSSNGGETAESIANAFQARVEADGGVLEAESCLIDRIQHLRTLGMWNKASAVWIPHGYKESKLYAVKGGAGADLGFTREGTRYRKGQTYVEQVPYNLLSRNREFDNASWQKVNATIVANTTTAPDGTTTADRMYPTTTGTFRGVKSAATITIAASNTYSVSVSAKAAGKSWLGILDPIGGVIVAWFNLSTGTVGTVTSPSTASIEDEGNGWYKCTMRRSASTVNGTSYLAVVDADGSSTATTNGTDGIYIWGAIFLPQFLEANPRFNTTNRFNVPALDYTNDTCPALSLEPARTNLLLRSEEFNNASWAKGQVTVTDNAIAGPDGLSTADKWLETTDNLQHDATQTTSKAVSALQYTVTVFIKGGLGRDWIYFQEFGGGDEAKKFFNISTGTLGTGVVTGAFTIQGSEIKDFGDGWYRCSLTFTTNTANTIETRIGIANADNSISYAGDITKGIYVVGAQLEQASYATSYIPTTTATVSRIADAVTALLPAGTNICLSSEVFNSPWSVFRATITTNATTAPNDTLTADAFLETAEVNSHVMTQSFVKSATINQYTGSIYVKPNGRDWIQFGFDNNAAKNVRCFFDVANGTVGTTSSATWTIQNANISPAANGFYRIDLTFTTDTDTALFCRSNISTDGSTTSYLGDITKGLYVWGAQLETGDTATTYVATTTAAKHNGTVIGQTEGTLYFEGSSFADGVSKNIEISDGTTSNNIRIVFANDNTITAITRTGAVDQALISTPFTTGVNYKIAVTYGPNYTALFVNGVKIGEDLSVTVPACSVIGWSSSGNSPFYGYARSRFISKTAISDSQAIALTTP